MATCNPELGRAELFELAPVEGRAVVARIWRSDHIGRLGAVGSSDGNGRCLYEEVYCARGEMENRIKECQMDLFADRASTRVSGHISSFTSGPYLGVVLRDSTGSTPPPNN